MSSWRWMGREVQCNEKYFGTILQPTLRWPISGPSVQKLRFWASPWARPKKYILALCFGHTQQKKRYIYKIAWQLGKSTKWSLNVKKSLETTTKISKNDRGPDNNPYLAQRITPEKAKLGPDYNICIYIYLSTHVYMRCRVKTWSKIWVFWVKTWSKVASKLGPSFLLLVFSPNFIVFFGYLKKHK